METDHRQCNAQPEQWRKVTFAFCLLSISPRKRCGRSDEVKRLQLGKFGGDNARGERAKSE